MQTYKLLIYTSLLFGSIGILLLALQKIDSLIPKYVNFIGKFFITIGFYLLTFSIITKNSVIKDTDMYWIFFGIGMLLFSTFFLYKDRYIY